MSRGNARRSHGGAGSTSSATGRGDLQASLVLIFPLLLAYEIGVLFAGRVNGADIVTRALYSLVGNRTTYLLVHAALALLFLLWIRRERRWGTLRFEIVAPVILEAAIYALTLGAVVSLVVERALGLGLDGSSIVSALGAGVHEELLFRLGVMSIIVGALRGFDRRATVVIAIVVSSLLFAAAHHAGVHGEPFTTHAFVFRTLAGCIFAAIYWFRSLAHAVYAHVLYDLVVAAS